jgi:CheY-like chemotaxis protein
MSSRSALIIEDNRELAIIFSQALQAAGFATGIMLDGDQALARLAITTPDVVVLDLHMPRVSGVEILRRIRADARLAGTRVIVATADMRATDMLQDQADLVLIKPVSFTQLRDLAGRLASPRPRPDNVL